MILSCLLLFACVSNVSVQPVQDETSKILEELIQEAMDDSNEMIKGVSMSVYSPKLGIQWSGAAGYDSSEKSDLLEASQPFRIASTTKTFVAAAMLRLQEMGALDLDDSIKHFISSEHQEILTKGGYSIDSITWRHCLSHTSGLFDYAMGGRTFIELAMKNPKKRWTRTDQLKLAMETGNKIGAPGERYRYSDTGYILAGEAIEQLTDSTLAHGLRALLNFESFELNSTWLESLEEAPMQEPRMVHRYFNHKDATDFDPSIDLYGGGGLVSTTGDLSKFMYALGSGAIFDSKESFQEMIATISYDPSYKIEDDPRYKEYKLGLWRISMYGMDVYMHAGLWGIYQVYIPALDSSIAINYTQGFRDRLLKKTILFLKNQHEKQEGL